MTTCYEWFSFPQELSVACPQCTRESRCVKAPIYKLMQVGETIIYVPLGVTGDFDGDVSCLYCGFVGRIKIHWPRDAFWKCDIKGKTLWAWSSGHAQVLLDYLQSPKRDEKAYPGYLSALLHLPTHFKLRRNREAAVRSLSQLIETQCKLKS